MNGSCFNNSFIEKRNIVINFEMRGTDIEYRRHKLYKVVRPSKYIKVRYITKNKEFYAEGYAESCEVNIFGELVSGQISIICPDPYWKSAEDTYAKFSESQALFEFPFSIVSEGIEFSRLLRRTITTIDAGNIETGAMIEFYATANGIIDPQLTNITTGETAGIEIEMQLGDKIIVNTNRSHKSVMLYRNGEASNLLSSRLEDFSWIQLRSGSNEISYSAGTGSENLDVTVTVTPKFLGV